MIKILPFILLLAACAAPKTQLEQHLEAERDFHAHMEYLQMKYDPEYIDDCLYHDDFVCEDEIESVNAW